MSSREDFKDDIEQLEDSLYSLCMQNGEQPDVWQKKKDKLDRERIFNMVEWAEKKDSSRGRKTERSEELRKMMDNLLRKDVGPIVFKRKMVKIRALFDAYLFDEMKAVLNDTTGSDVQTTITDADKTAIIKATDAALKADFSLENWLKADYVEETYTDDEKKELREVACKMADMFSHICKAETKGKREKINEDFVTSALNLAEKWTKSRAGKARSVKLSRLLAVKVIKKIARRKHFYCMDCRVTSFNVLQFLAHIANGVHRKHVTKVIDDEREGTAMLFALAHNYMLTLSTICDDIHTSYVKQHLTPIIESGGQILAFDRSMVPINYLYEKLERKYGPFLDVDEKCSIDATYLATTFAKVVKNHAEDPVGAELFKEIDEYLSLGEEKENKTRKERQMEEIRATLLGKNHVPTKPTYYCKVCNLLCGCRPLFYVHIMNPFHLIALDLQEGYSMRKFTISINLHGPRPSLSPAYIPPAKPMFSGDDVEIIGEVSAAAKFVHVAHFNRMPALKPAVQSTEEDDASEVQIKRNIQTALQKRGMALTAKYPSDEKERGIVRDFASTYVDALMARRQAERRRSVLKGKKPVGIKNLTEKDLAMRTLPERYSAPPHRFQFKDPRFAGNVNVFNDVWSPEDNNFNGPAFIKINKNILLGTVINSSLPFCCSCTSDCSENSQCECRALSTDNVTLMDDGRVVIRVDDYFKTHLYTCGTLCSCNVQSCKNRLPYEEKANELEVVRRNRKMGFEVRALRQYSLGEVVIEFFGDVEANLDAGEEQDFSFLVYDGYNQSEKMFVEKGDLKFLPDKIYINPFHRGGMARFAGHSRLNNVYPLRVYASGMHIGIPRLVFICSLTIPPGDFVKVNYGNTYHRTIAECYCPWGERCDCDNACLCDEKLCHNLHVLGTIKNEEHALNTIRRREVENRVRIQKMEIEIREEMNGEQPGEWDPIQPYPENEKWEIVPSFAEEKREREEREAKKEMEEEETTEEEEKKKKKSEKGKKKNDEDEETCKKKKKRSVAKSKVDGPKNKKLKTGKK